MKALLKKINRGVILSIIVILCIVGYYVVLGIKTAPVRKEMESLMTDFFGTYAQCAIVPKEYIKDNQTEEGIKPLLDSIHEKFEPYFSDEESLDNFMKIYSDEQIYNQAIYQNNLITSLSVNFKKFQSTKVDFQKNTASSTAVAAVDEKQVYYDLQWDENGKISSKQERSSNFKSDKSYSVTFTKINNKWLITSFDYYRVY